MDIDLAILVSDRRIVDGVVARLIAKGFRVRQKGLALRLKRRRRCLVPINFLSVGIKFFLAHPQSSTAVSNHYSDCRSVEVRLDQLSDPVTVRIYGFTFLAPRDPERLLVDWYGPNWRVPQSLRQ